MSRVSLYRRLQAVLEAAETIDPYSARVHRMTPAVRLQFDRWRRCVDAEYARFDGKPAGGAYEALLEGTLHLPEPPLAVAEALGLPEPIVLHEDLTAGELEAAWSAMIGD